MDTMITTNQKTSHVLMIPFPTQSHIKAMLKLAKLLHHKGIHITFLNTKSNHERLLKVDGPQCLDAIPGFQFKNIPDGLPSNPDDNIDVAQDTSQLFCALLVKFLPGLLDLVRRLEIPPTCIISDGFLAFTNIIEAVEKLGIPLMHYWAFAACGFMGYYLAKILVEKGLIPLKDESYLTNGYLDTPVNWIPGMEQIRLRDLPSYVLVTDPKSYFLNFHVETAKAAEKVSRMIIQTFDDLEPSIVKKLKSIFPQVYTVGPLQLLLNQITQEKETDKSNFNNYSLWKEEPKCVHWLHSKEPNSVLYVNFGSLITMSLQDLVEFGWGLINSNYYILWIIRPGLIVEGPSVLPMELEQAFEKKGFIASWCSQDKVLNHPSIGGFLTHCGWASTIESVSAGVPMIGWPNNTEQPTNCRQMCVEWEVGMEIGSNVKRDEVEKLVRELMEGEKGKRMKQKAMEFKKMAEFAAGPNGSSFLNLEKLVNEIATISKK